jgi:hypothetical protein
VDDTARTDDQGSNFISVVVNVNYARGSSRIDISLWPLAIASG